ncbi:MAG: hypothetical protein JST20_01660 [Bacteroidetes bacterium]|nr:hypothetical protein [Bacteroidota bacterium]
MKTNSNSFLPLVIGITGHRNIRSEDRPILATKIREFFEYLEISYPDTPLLLLSPLAEGADRLAAEIAFEKDIEVIVPLPFDSELYEKDFVDSVVEFREMTKKAKYTFELPILAGSTYEEVSDYGLARDRQYALVGSYIARHCQILLALWDGLPLELVGSTAQVVRFKVEGIPYPYVNQNPLDIVESGPVYHIVTPRENQFKLIEKPFENKWIYPEDDIDKRTKEFNQIFQRINQYNRDVKEFSTVLSTRKQTSKQYVIPTETIKKLPYSLLQTLDRYATADVLAGFFQVRTLRTLFWLFILVFIVVSAQVASYIATGNPWILLTYVLGLGVAYTWYLWARRGEFEKKYLDYRALAEGLRIQLFWEIGGIENNVADHYMRKQKGELDWIRNAVITWSIPEEGSSVEQLMYGSTVEARLQFVGKHWITDQYNYFRKSAVRDRKKLEKLQLWGNIFFIVGLLLATLETSFDFFLTSNPLTKITLLIGIAQVIGALLHGYSEKRLLNEQSRQYTRMGTLFSNAKRYYELKLAENEYELAQSLILDLGKEALVENGDWVLLHRERPMEVPKAG